MFVFMTDGTVKGTHCFIGDNELAGIEEINVMADAKTAAVAIKLKMVRAEFAVRDEGLFKLKNIELDENGYPKYEVITLPQILTLIQGGK